MISFDKDVVVMVGLQAVDFRSGMNRLGAIAEEVFNKEAMSGVLFAFRNKKKTDIKFLLYDGTGFFLGHKRLSKGKLSWWPRTDTDCVGLSGDKFLRLLHGVDPRPDFHPDWERLKIDKKR